MRHKKQNRNKKKNRISPQKEEGDTALFSLGRGTAIRTQDPLLPKQVR